MIRCHRRGETNNTTHSPKYHPPLRHDPANARLTTPRNGKTPNLQRLGVPMGVLVPQTLTANPRPVHPPVHAAPAPANKPSRGGIAHIPQGSRSLWFRVVPGHSVPEGAGIAHIRPIPAIPPRRQRLVWRGFDRRGSPPSTARRLFEMVGSHGGDSGSGYGEVGAATGERGGVDEPLSGKWLISRCRR